MQANLVWWETRWQSFTGYIPDLQGCSPGCADSRYCDRKNALAQGATDCLSDVVVASSASPMRPEGSDHGTVSLDGSIAMVRCGDPHCLAADASELEVEVQYVLATETTELIDKTNVGAEKAYTVLAELGDLLRHHQNLSLADKEVIVAKDAPRVAGGQSLRGAPVSYSGLVQEAADAQAVAQAVAATQEVAQAVAVAQEVAQAGAVAEIVQEVAQEVVDAVRAFCMTPFSAWRCN